MWSVVQSLAMDPRMDPRMNPRMNLRMNLRMRLKTNDRQGEWRTPTEYVTIRGTATVGERGSTGPVGYAQTLAGWEIL